MDATDASVGGREAVRFAVRVVVLPEARLAGVLALAAAPARRARGLRVTRPLCTLAASRVTSRASLSSRAPRKIGWRSRLSAVHSLNFTSTTTSGRTQCAFSFVRTGVENGDDFRSSRLRRFAIAARLSRVKPPPVWPTY